MTGQTILNYKIISLIGEGGMGSVYLGEHLTLGRKAAIKVLLPELAHNKMIKDRFINEAKTLSKLNHQNIVTLYDFSEAGGKLMLVMEFVEGTPLDTVIEKNTGAIPEPRALNIFRQVLEGFSYAHREGIIHRDIKPSNIILKSDDTPKILDFGIAKILQGDIKLTQTGTRLGSVVYMSPEQVMGNEADRRSDIYSLGVTLFEMLTGSLPYNTKTESEFDIQTKIVREPLPLIRNINPAVSELLEKAVIKATEKDVNNRFGNCEEFTDFLSSGTKSYNVQKTVIREPVSAKTVIQPVYNTPVYTPRKKFKPLHYIGGFIILVIIAAAMFYIFKDDSVEKNVKQNSKLNTVITEAGVKEFIDNWLTNQNSKNIEQYLSMYDPSFNGIKRTVSGKATYLNYNEWKDDRRKMYVNAEGLMITAKDIVIKNIDKQNGTANVEFTQHYYSSKYSDEGKKILNLKLNSEGVLKIVFEEMVYSTNTGE